MSVLSGADASESAERIKLESIRTHDFHLLLWMTALVAIGVIFEGPEISHEVRTAWLRCRGRRTRVREAVPWITLAAAFGWLLIVIGVAGEGYWDAAVSHDDQAITSFDEDKLGSTEKTAGDAQSNAGAAAKAAQEATDAAAHAREESDKASASSSHAMDLAQGARGEADSFERDIVSAKQQAADAESHLADALRQAAQAQEALERIKTPRSLSHTKEMIAALSAFKGTKYVFTSVSQEGDAIDLLKSINDLLQKSGWERDKSIGGFPAINVYGKDDPDFSVPAAISTVGVHISVESEEKLDVLQSRGISNLPQYVRAALDLNLNLPSNIIPKAEDAAEKLVTVEKGTSTTVRIAVGTKPLQ